MIDDDSRKLTLVTSPIIVSGARPCSVKRRKLDGIVKPIKMNDRILESTTELTAYYDNASTNAGASEKPFITELSSSVMDSDKANCLSPNEKAITIGAAGDSCSLLKKSSEIDQTTTDFKYYPIVDRRPLPPENDGSFKRQVSRDDCISPSPDKIDDFFIVNSFDCQNNNELLLPDNSEDIVCKSQRFPGGDDEKSAEIQFDYYTIDDRERVGLGSPTIDDDDDRERVGLGSPTIEDGRYLDNRYCISPDIGSSDKKNKNAAADDDSLSAAAANELPDDKNKSLDLTDDDKNIVVAADYKFKPETQFDFVYPIDCCEPDDESSRCSRINQTSPTTTIIIGVDKLFEEESGGSQGITNSQMAAVADAAELSLSCSFDSGMNLTDTWRELNICKYK